MNTYRNTRNVKHLLNYHFIWIPKYRNSILTKEPIKKIIKDTIEELGHNHGYEVLALEIMPDHVHLFVSVLPKYAPSNLMNIIKGTTGRRVAKEFPEVKANGSIWTRSYFVATIGNVSSETIKKYIEDQGGN